MAGEFSNDARTQLRLNIKRILYIHHAGGIGGAPLSLLYLLQALDRTKYEPVVVTLKPGPVVDLYRQQGIETHVAAGIDDFSHTNLEWYGGRELWRLPGKLLSIVPSIIRTRDLVRRIQPDIVHLNSSTLTPSALGCALAGVPVVWHIREPLARGYIGLRRGWIRRVLDRHAVKVVAICQHDADQLIASERIHVIYNYIHFDRFDRTLSGEAVRAELGIAPDAPVVTMLGGVSEPKGTLTLVQALPALIAALPDVRVVIAGPPPKHLGEPGFTGMVKKLLGVDAYQKRVQAAIDRLKPPEREALIFTGIRRDIPEVLAASTCLVFPSSVAHFARPIIEAAAMGLPAVGSDLGGPQELIVDRETGLLVPPDDPEALAQALAEILSQPESARQMGEAAYRRARELFDADTNAAATIALYEGLG